MTLHYRVPRFDPLPVAFRQRGVNCVTAELYRRGGFEAKALDSTKYLQENVNAKFRTETSKSCLHFFFFFILFRQEFSNVELLRTPETVNKTEENLGVARKK